MESTMNISRLVYAFVSVIFFAWDMSAQNDVDLFEKHRQNVERRFEEVRARNDKVFEGYRDKMNKEFASYLKKEWRNTTLSEAMPYPFRPEPKPIVDNTPAEESRPLPHSEPVAIPEPETQPSPVEPIPSMPVDAPPVAPASNGPDTPPVVAPFVTVPNGSISFKYLGNNCTVRVPATKDFKVPTASNEEIANAWNALSEEKYNDMIVDCLCIRKSLQLCDWAFYDFIRAFTVAYIGSEDSNEAVVVQVYIMVQLGYKIRLAKQGCQCIALLAFKDQLFAAPYLTIEGENFYCFYMKDCDTGIQFCDYQFPGEQACSVRMKEVPMAAENSTAPRTVKSKAYSHAVAKVSTNKNLMSFYDSYPACGWEIFAAASLSQSVKDQLYPSLRLVIDNMAEPQAVNLLLNFVQTGFEYKTDDEQFGHEKSFFGDEMFYYPYCDCEDRSILFSILVRDLLGLDVVLLDYPSHIATAVKFTIDVKGDYFDIDGDKYVICDPTYIGAPIGKSMPDMLHLKANILKIN